MRREPTLQHEKINARKRAKPWTRQDFICHIEETWIDAIGSYYCFALARNNGLSDTESAQRWYWQTKFTLELDLYIDLYHRTKGRFSRKKALATIKREMLEVDHLSKNYAMSYVQKAFANAKIKPKLSDKDTKEFIHMFEEIWLKEEKSNGWD